MATPKLARVTVGPLPAWLEATRLCGAAPEACTSDDAGRLFATFALSYERAALLAAQLRGLGFGGRPLDVRVVPALRRDEVRAGRLAEARARRETTPGFDDARALAEGEGRYSLTPERLALVMGARLTGKRVVDACAGSGGNALGFARNGARVTAIDNAAARRAELAHNAKLYGVTAQIDIVAGDALLEVPGRSADVLFVDPPWGERYDRTRTGLASLPLLADLLRCDLRGYGEIWLKVPPSFDPTELPGYAVEAWFGDAPGDRQRVKFLLLSGQPAPARGLSQCGPEVASPTSRR